MTTQQTKAAKYPKRIQTVVRRTRGPRAKQQVSIECPEAGDLVYCYRFANNNPDATFDFFLQWAVVGKAGNCQSMTFTPCLLPDGGQPGLIVTSLSVEYEQVKHIRSERTWEMEDYNFGVLQISRLEVDRLYQELRATAFETACDLLVYELTDDGDLRMIDVKTVQVDEMPPLPPADTFARPEQAARSAESLAVAAPELLDFDYRYNQMDETNSEFSSLVYFPNCEPVKDEHGKIVDFEVSGGKAVTASRGGGPSLVECGQRSVGGYIDAVEQAANPSMTMLIFSDRDRRIRFFKMCYGFSYHQIQNLVMVEKKSSWFKKKVKITELFEEIKRQGTRCVKRSFF